MITLSPAFRISLLIWVRAVLITVLMFGVYSIYELGFAGVLVLFVTLIVGFLFTFPLVFFVNPIVKSVAKMPYNLNGKLASLSILLTLLAFSFEWLIAWKFAFDIFADNYCHPFLVSNGLSIALACWSVRDAFVQLKIHSPE